MTDEWLQTISDRYIELYEKITGEKFHPQKWNDQQTEEAINNSLEHLK